MCCSVDNGAQLADDGVSDGDAGSRKIVSVLSITPAYLGCAARYVLPGYVVAVLHAGAIRAGAIRVVADRDKVMDDVIRHIFCSRPATPASCSAMSAAAAAVRVARSPYSKNGVLRRAVDYTLALREGGVTGARSDGMRVVDLAKREIRSIPERRDCFFTI